MHYRHKGGITMVKVRMLVQTAYHGELLRAGKEYEVEEAIAERWVSSGIAERIDK